jgi:hypothetical protein
MPVWVLLITRLKSKQETRKKKKNTLTTGYNMGEVNEVDVLVIGAGELTATRNSLSC